jgi:hypothetical protein
LSSQGVTSKELSFRAFFPVTAFFKDLSHAVPDTDNFTRLLTGGDMEAKAAILVGDVKVGATQAAFDNFLQRLCVAARLQLVETVPRTASLFASTIHGHPVALLLKCVVSAF